MAFIQKTKKPLRYFSVALLCRRHFRNSLFPPLLRVPYYAAGPLCHSLFRKNRNDKPHPFPCERIRADAGIHQTQNRPPSSARTRSRSVRKCPPITPCTDRMNHEHDTSRADCRFLPARFCKGAEGRQASFETLS